MKKTLSLILFVLLSTTVLSGCISKRPQELILPEDPLPEDNRAEAIDPSGRFSMILPKDVELVVDQEEETARLLRVNEKVSGRTVMFFEENLTTVDQAISLLANLDEVTKVSEEPITINDLQGKKVLVELSTNTEHITPYYFLQGGQFTYVFSLMRGESYEHFVRIVNSFERLN
jgi:hypothetical protein